jgi:hypothetical protein
MISVPKIDHPYLPLLLKTLTLSGPTIEVPVEVDPSAKPNECFNNVQDRIGQAGGKRIIGWQISDYGFMLAAELHAVWLAKENKYIDISPKAFPISHILFVIDPTIVFEGRQKNNVRINTTTNRLVDDYIALANAEFAMTNKGELADVVGKIVFRGKEAEQWQVINDYILRIETMMDNGQSRNSPCFCSSGAKYKHCHGQDLIHNLQRVG